MPWDALLPEADHHGLGPLLRAHLADAGVEIPGHITAALQDRWLQQAHRYAVRHRVLGEALRELNNAAVPVLLLSGAALAQAVYADPVLRPVRSVELLVRPTDALIAHRVLRGIGFCATDTRVAIDHRDLPGLSKTVDGATVSMTLRHQILPAHPFLPSLGYHELAGRSQPVEWSGLPVRTLGPEDMLWHVYAHAFTRDIFHLGIRLISVADLVALTETWCDEMDWDVVRQRYGRAFRALPILNVLTPWPARVVEKFGWDLPARSAGVDRIASMPTWSAASGHDVLCPPDWWLRVCYGTGGRADRLRHLVWEHPVRLVVGACQAAAFWLAQRVDADRDLGSRTAGASAWPRPTSYVASSSPGSLRCVSGDFVVRSRGGPDGLQRARRLHLDESRVESDAYGAVAALPPSTQRPREAAGRHQQEL